MDNKILWSTGFSISDSCDKKNQGHLKLCPIEQILYGGLVLSCRGPIKTMEVRETVG